MSHYVRHHALDCAVSAICARRIHGVADAGFAAPHLAFRQAQIWWNHVLLTMWSERVFGRAWSSEPRALSFAAIHGDAVQTLLKLAYETPDHLGQSMQPRDYFARALACAGSKAQETAQEGESFGSRRAAALQSELQHFVYDLRHVPGAFQVCRDGHELLLSDAESDPEKLYPHFQPYLEFGYLLRAMRILRLQFRPRTMKAYDSDNQVGLAYAEFVRTTCERVCEHRKQRIE